MPPEPWYADGLHFTCTQCGNSCTGPAGYVWFDADEGRAIAAQLGVDEKTFYARYAKKLYGRWSLSEIARDNGDHDCVFLTDLGDGKRGCAIYQDRPTQCRTWPFWPENLKSPAAYRRAGRRCPGMTRGLNEKVRAEDRGTFFPIEKIRVLRDATE